MRKGFFVLACFAVSAIATAQSWEGQIFRYRANDGASSDYRIINGGQFGIITGGFTTNEQIRFFFGPSPLAPEVPLLLTNTVTSVGRPMAFTSPGTVASAFDTKMLPAGVNAADVRLNILRNHKWVTLTGGQIFPGSNSIRCNVVRTGTYGLIGTTYNSSFSDDIIVNVYGLNVDQTRLNQWYKVRDVGLVTPATAVAVPMKHDLDQRVYLSPAYNALFSSRRTATGGMELNILSADGGNPDPISNLGASRIGDVAVDGEGMKVVFAAMVAGSWNIYSSGVDGTSLTTLLSGVTSALAGGPKVALTPLGTQAAITNGNDISIVDVPGGSVIRTITMADEVRGLGYNSSASRLAVTTGSGLYTIDLPLGTPFLRESGSTFRDNPTFSPSGLRIAVHSDTGVDLLTLNPKSWHYGVLGPLGSGNPEYQVFWR